MRSIKVNADYESVLFRENKSLPLVNEAIEFLAFYLEDVPILTQKKYDPKFLAYVESLIGREVKLVKEGDYRNWWGELRFIDLEKNLNSKEMSTILNIEEDWSLDTKILTDLTDLPDLSDGKTYLAKNPYGMSGQNFCFVSQESLGNISQLLKSGKVILEPYLDRVYDFSHFIYPNGKTLCYQNLIDSKFQYRGTLFYNSHNPVLTELNFYSKISSDKWDKFSFALEKIKNRYTRQELTCGFSVDSFVYQENGELNIRYLSEVNYRRTMGQVAYELSQKLAPDYPWTFFVLSKSTGLNFNELKSRISPFENILLLSPGNVRYDMFFMRAKNEIEGVQLFNALKILLPSSEFAIKI